MLLAPRPCGDVHGSPQGRVSAATHSDVAADICPGDRRGENGYGRRDRRDHDEAAVATGGRLWIRRQWVLGTGTSAQRNAQAATETGVQPHTRDPPRSHRGTRQGRSRRCRGSSLQPEQSIIRTVHPRLRSQLEANTHRTTR